MKRDVIALTLSSWILFLSEDQPCFYGCGVRLPQDDSAASTARRREHFEECPCCPTATKRAAILINDARRERAAHTQEA